MPDLLGIPDKINHLVEGEAPRLDSQRVFGCVSYTWAQNHDRGRRQTPKPKPFDDVEEIWHALGGSLEFTKEDLRQWVRMAVHREDAVLQYKHSCPFGRGVRCKLRRKQMVLDFVLWYRTKHTELAGILSDPYECLPRMPSTTKPVSVSAGQILEVLKPLDPVRRRHVFRALYCVSLAQRPLTAKELLAATTTDVDMSAQKQGSHSLPTDAEDLMTLCAGLLTTGKRGFVHFTSPTLRDYLIHSKVGEFKSGHTLMAKICLQHLANTPVSVLRPWDDFGTALSNDCKQPFLRYVACFWDLHYKLAEPDSHELPRYLFQLIGRAYQVVCALETGVDHSTGLDQAQGRSIDVGFELCTFSDFKILAATYSHMGARPIPRRTKILRSVDRTRPCIRCDIQLIEPCSADIKSMCTAPPWPFASLNEKMWRPQYIQNHNSSGDVTDITTCSEEPQRGMPDNSNNDNGNVLSLERPHIHHQRDSSDEMETSWDASEKFSKHTRHSLSSTKISQDLLHCGSWIPSLSYSDLGTYAGLLPTEEIWRARRGLEVW